jgi:hypothetical protein
MIYISSNNDRHPVAETFTPVHYTCRHFASSHLKLHPTTLHSISLQLPTVHFLPFQLHPPSLHNISQVSATGLLLPLVVPHWFFSVPFFKYLGKLESKKLYVAGLWNVEIRTGCDTIQLPNPPPPLPRPGRAREIVTPAKYFRPHCTVRDCYQLAHCLYVHTAMSVIAVNLRTVFTSTLRCPWLLSTCALSLRPHCIARDCYLLAHCIYVHTALSVIAINLRTVFTSTLHCPWLLSTCAVFTSTLHCPWLLSTCARSLRPHCTVRDCYQLAHCLYVHTALSVIAIYLRTVFTSTLHFPWLVSTCALSLRPHCIVRDCCLLAHCFYDKLTNNKLIPTGTYIYQVL